MKKLNDVTSIKEIEELSPALFPGHHCSLFGASLAIKEIKDALMLVIGTDECSYYTKKMSLGNDNFYNRVLSLILDAHDISFGFKEKLEDAVKEIKEENPENKLIFLVTTCVVELIGEDIDSIVDKISKELGLNLIAVHTEHFKTPDHNKGLESVLTSMINLMQFQEKTNSVNILGHRNKGFAYTEFNKILEENNYNINLSLPSECTTNDILIAPRAMVNIVTNTVALPLAKKMKDKFNIDYVEFTCFVNPNHILESYNKLKVILNLDVNLEERYNAIKEKEKEFISKNYNYSFIYGNTPFDIFELSDYLVYLGFIPLLLQCSNFDDKYISNKLRYANPYISRSANIAPLQKLYDELKPNFYFGHEFAERLRKKRIIVKAMDRLGSKMGFESTESLLLLLEESVKDYKELEYELG